MCKTFRLLGLLLTSFFPSRNGQFVGFSRSAEITANKSETFASISCHTRTDMDRNYMSFIYIKYKVGRRVMKIGQIKRWSLTKHTVRFQLKNLFLLEWIWYKEEKAASDRPASIKVTQKLNVVTRYDRNLQHTICSTVASACGTSLDTGYILSPYMMD